MISQLTGTLIEKSAVNLVLDVNGVGYKVRISLSTAERLLNVGETLSLFTFVSYRGDTQELFGFLTKQERDLFELIVQKVPGIGPRIALMLLSMQTENLCQAIQTGDTTTLSKCPGLGKKTAERLVIELRDKLPFGFKFKNNAFFSPAEKTVKDAIAALKTLGYKEKNAEQSIQKAQKTLSKDASTEQLIRKALS